MRPLRLTLSYRSRIKKVIKKFYVFFEVEISLIEFRNCDLFRYCFQDVSSHPGRENYIDLFTTHILSHPGHIERLSSVFLK